MPRCRAGRIMGGTRISLGEDGDGLENHRGASGGGKGWDGGCCDSQPIRSEEGGGGKGWGPARKGDLLQRVPRGVSRGRRRGAAGKGTGAAAMAFILFAAMHSAGVSLSPGESIVGAPLMVQRSHSAASSRLSCQHGAAKVGDAAGQGDKDGDLDGCGGSWMGIDCGESPGRLVVSRVALAAASELVEHCGPLDVGAMTMMRLRGGGEQQQQEGGNIQPLSPLMPGTAISAHAPATEAACLFYQPGQRVVQKKASNNPAPPPPSQPPYTPSYGPGACQGAYQRPYMGQQDGQGWRGGGGVAETVRGPEPHEFATIRVVVPSGVQPGQYIEVMIPGKGPTLVAVPANTLPGQQLEVRYPAPKPPVREVGLGGGMRTVSVVVPEGVVPGQKIEVRVEQGNMLVVVPQGALPGQQLQVRYYVPEPRTRMGANAGHWSAQRWPAQGRGRPPGGGTPRMQVMRPPALPPRPEQLVRRIVVMGTHKRGDAIGLAAQYNVSLYIVTGEALEFAALLPGMAGGGRWSGSKKANNDVVMAMAWQLTAQVPSRAVVWLNIANETTASRVAKAFQYHGRGTSRPLCVWETVDTMVGTANVTMQTPGNKDYVWRFHAGEWGWVDEETMSRAPEGGIIKVENRTFDVHMPSPPSPLRWAKAGKSWVTISPASVGPGGSLAGSEGPPGAFQLFKQTAKEAASFSVESMRRSAEVFSKFSDELKGNLSAGLELLKSCDAGQAVDVGVVKELGIMCEQHSKMAACFTTNGWNGAFRRFDRAPEAEAGIAALEKLLGLGAGGGVGSGVGAVRGEVNKVFAIMWNELDEEERQGFHELSLKLAEEWKNETERVKEEDRRRRQSSFSLEVTTAKRSRRQVQDNDYVLNYDELLGGRGGGAGRKMRGSWRAVTLYGLVAMNATSVETSVTKQGLIGWIRSQKPEMDRHDIPEYLGLQLANMCRDKTVAVVRNTSQVLADTPSKPGRPEALYYALPGSSEMLPAVDQIWPTARGKGSGRGGGDMGEDHAKRVQMALERQAKHRGMRARFVLDNWREFSPFFEGGHKGKDGPLAEKLRGYEAAMAGTSQGAGEDEGGVKVPVRGQPACITGGEMREYQIDGLKWLVKQHDSGVGGVLGDEMGLGKTLQCISFLGFLKTVRKENSPHLVVAPLSVMNSWIAECARWCPSLRVVAFHGSSAERERLRTEVLHKGDFDVCCTTYEMLTADTHGLSARFQWGYVVLDEAHRAKNERSNLGQAVRKLKCNSRLLITGTPLQNSLHELWSLLNILFPEALSSSAAFDAGFRIAALYQQGNGGEEVADAGLIVKAHHLLQPLMLRRLKKDVLSTELPPKIETKITVGLSDMQRFMYGGLLRRDLAPLSKGDGSLRRPEQGRLSSLIMHLRKICNHPYLLPDSDPMVTDERILAASSKLMLLDKLLTKLRSEGRKCLIYSQFTSMLDVIGDYLAWRDYKYLRLDGSTPAARRRYEIARFESPRSDYFCYLISTRAGGLGVTLVAADTVILYDSDWNPTADLQAMDRVHRIGQKKNVNVYRLVTQGTVEERIVAAAETKQTMNALVMQDDVSNQAGEGKGKNGGEGGGGGMVSLLKTILEGSQCLRGNVGGVNVSSADIEEILANAETRNVTGSPNASGGGAVEDNHKVHGEGAGGAEGDIEAGVEDEKEVLSTIFSTLPGVHEFEGTDYSRKDTFRDLADQWADTHRETKRKSLGRVRRVGGHNVIAWSLDDDRARDSATGALKSSLSGSKQPSKPKLKHRRWCQRCHLEGGTMLFCSRCPVVMHRFCVKAEGLIIDGDDDAEEEEGGGLEGGGVQGFDAEAEATNSSAADDSWDVSKEHPPTAPIDPAEAGLSSEVPVMEDVQGDADDVVVGPEQREEGGMCARDERVCTSVLSALLRRRDGQHFARPQETTPDDMISNRMDLGTVLRRLREGRYTSVAHFADDVRLTFSNAMTVHGTETKVYKAARNLRKMFTDVCKELGLKDRHGPSIGDWPYDYIQMCKRLVKNKDAPAFMHPVDPQADGCQDYHEVISDPMDLGTVLSRLESGNYTSPDEMALDFRRTLQNAMRYNPPKHPVYMAAKRLIKQFEERFGRLQRPAPGALDTVGGNETVSAIRKVQAWMCPHHRCFITSRPASDAGGLLFRCCDCPRALSDDVLEDGFEAVNMDKAFSKLRYRPPTSAEYIRCVTCTRRSPNATLSPDVEDAMEDEGESEEIEEEEEEEEEAMDLSVDNEDGRYAGRSQGESEEEEEEEEEEGGGSEYEVRDGDGDEDEDEDENESSVSVAGRRGVKRRLFQKEKSGIPSANSSRRSPRVAAAASVRGTPSKRVAASVRGTPSKGSVPENSAGGGMSSRRSPRLATASGEEKTAMKRKARQSGTAPRSKASNRGRGRVDQESDAGVEDASSSPKGRSVIEGFLGGIKAMMGGGRKSPRLSVAAEREREKEREREREREKGLRRSPRLRGR